MTTADEAELKHTMISFPPDKLLHDVRVTFEHLDRCITFSWTIQCIHLQHGFSSLRQAQNALPERQVFSPPNGVQRINSSFRPMRRDGAVNVGLVPLITTDSAYQ